LQWKKAQVRHEVKEQMVEGMDRAELVEIRLGWAEMGELEWEHEKEFEYQGEMYDVVEKRVEGGEMVFLCWPDQQESALNRQLEQLAARALGHDSDHQHHQQLTQRFFNSLFPPQMAPAPHFPSFPSPEYLISNDIFSPQLHLTPPVPPPSLV